MLFHIMEDNPKLATLYTTGVFFFILMYTGSNLLPIGRFLSQEPRQAGFQEREHRGAGLKMPDGSLVFGS